MRRRRAVLLLTAICLGCRSARPEAEPAGPELPPAPAAQSTGEPPLAARPVEAEIVPASHREGAAAEREASRLTDGLTRATRAIEAGDAAGAVPHLRAYLTREPGHALIRAYLGDLLLQLDRPGEAREEYERFVAEAQEAAGAARGHLPHCHTRLMEACAKLRDRFGESLNRGVALYLLSEPRPGSPAEDPATREATLCRAARALRDAADAAPADARPQWYLARVWTALGQPQAATVALRAARERAPESLLTPAERRALLLEAGIR